MMYVHSQAFKFVNAVLRSLDPVAGKIKRMKDTTIEAVCNYRDLLTSALVSVGLKKYETPLYRGMDCQVDLKVDSDEWSDLPSTSKLPILSETEVKRMKKWTR